MLRALASTWIAVVVVAAFILLSIAGAMLPQTGPAGQEAVEAWQAAHGVVTAVARPLGLFDAFSSIPFMVLLAVLAVNLVACTVRRMLKARNARGGDAAALAGSLILHLGLLVILAGGVATAGFHVDGRVVATEGQAVDLGREDQYLGLSRGVWADGALPQVELGVVASRSTADDGAATGYESELSLIGYDDVIDSRLLAINRPVRYQGVILTHADWGFSPLVTVVSPTGEIPVDAYVALSSAHGAGTGAFVDVLVAPGLPGTVRLTVLPDLILQGGAPVSASSEPRNPALEVALLDEDGAVLESATAPLGSEVAVGGFNFVFGDLRRWTAVRVRADAGRWVVYAGFALGLAGLLVRYAPAVLAARRRYPERIDGVVV